MERVHEQLSEREFEILRLIEKGSSDREIAQALYLSLNTIKWHNRQIYAKLGVSSRTGAVAAASDQGLFEDQPVTESKSALSRKHNLPAQVSSFVGREKEINQIKKLLESTRLLTLTGPGGVGKTRLALQVAEQLEEENLFQDGIYFLELAPVTKPERVGEAIVQALGLISQAGQEASEQLKYFLAERDLLLLIDNFEHLLEAASLVGELLQFAPKLKILCTSREALDLSGEQIFPIRPLKKNTSNVLFVQRAQEVKPNFDPDEDELVIINQICTRLDGLPLAIELAAARMKLFNLEPVLKQLEDRFATLKDGPRDAPDRHQTLQKAIDWSYQLLSKEEKILFNRLSVFQGSRTIEAIEQVCCQELNLNILDGLESLYAKNMLRQEEGIDGELRFFMLETIHEYARERLIESGEAQEIHRRHAVYFTELAERAKYPTRGGPEQIRWLLRLETDRGNLRAMYDWSMDGGDVELGLRLVGALDYFWFRTGHHYEGEEWVVRSLEVINEVPPAVKAGVYSSAGMVYSILQERILSKQMYQEALVIYQELGDRRETGWTHVLLMNTSEGISGEDIEIREHFKRGVALLREFEDNVGIAQALTILGVHEEELFDTSNARIAIEESLSISREIGDEIRQVINLYYLGWILFDEGFTEPAQDKFKESLSLEVSLGYIKEWAAARLSALATTAEALDQTRRAIVLLSAAENMFNRRGLYPQRAESPTYRKTRSHLDEETFETAWAEGQVMTPDEAIAYALEGKDE
ncbi:MAG: LuxR C-terminal-related transcriptional regulator [Anaerolineaceae bacterium]|nr:LuxR C-terminal-related transcriptional regulator [Anaerolineaceae bacterium]